MNSDALNGAVGAAWLLLRADVRRRGLAVLSLAMLVGLAGTFVLTAATGARRADTALERFLEDTAMWDASIEVDFPATEEVLADVATRPEVAAASAAVFIPLVSEEIETGVIAGLAPGWLREVYRPRIIAGRLPDPRKVDELLVNEDEARRHDFVPGDVVVLEDFLDLGIAQPMTIVGVHRGVVDLALGDTYPGAIATEAFGRRFGDQLYAVVADTPDAGLVRPQIVARMNARVDDPLQVLEAVADRHEAARPRVVGRSAFVSPIERALAVQVEAFWILTVISGASALVLLGMAVARLASSGTHPAETLSALGFEARQRGAVALAAPALVVVAGGALGIAGAVVASPVVPLGSARVVEPDPGMWIHPETLLIGGLVQAIGLVLVAAAFIRLDRLHAGRVRRSALGALPMPLAATLGHDLAYRESSWGRLALAGTGVGLGLVVSVSVYSASLDRLLRSPSLFGSDYDAVVFPSDDGPPEGGFADIDLDDPTIESVAISQVAQLTVGGDLLEAQVIEPVRGAAGGTILRGRAPRADDEVALGPTTADRLRIGVGDELAIGDPGGHTVRIVGEAVMPLQGQGAYGEVMWMTPAAAARLGVEPYEPRLLLKLAEGTTVEDVGGEGVYIPDDVSNLDGVGQIPAALAIFGALLSASVLTFALFGILRRRQHDLAILRTLGLSPRRLRGSVLTACLLIVGPGVAMGILIGSVLGRTYWSSVAAGVPAVARPAMPLVMTALLVLGGLAATGLVVMGPARLVTRTRPAEVLQRD